MINLFPPLKNINLPNVITSFAVFLAVFSQSLLLRNNVKLALTVYVFVLLLNRLDGVAARHLRRVTDFGKDLGNLSEVVNLLVVPVFFAYCLGFNAWYSGLLFALYILAGLWRLADFCKTGMVEVEGKNCFRGICCTHASAVFTVVSAFYIKFSNGMADYFFIPFFVLASLLMISSFLYKKNGVLTLLLYVLVALAIIIMWL